MIRYNEAEQLTKLLKAFVRLMEADMANDTISTVMIYVGNRRVKLLAGAPQFEGICKMVEHIAEENLYDVNFDELTVTDGRPSLEEVCLKALQYSLEQAKTSKIDVLGTSPTSSEYWITKAIEALQQKETEE